MPKNLVEVVIMVTVTISIMIVLTVNPVCVLKHLDVYIHTLQDNNQYPADKTKKIEVDRLRENLV